MPKHECRFWAPLAWLACAVILSPGLGCQTQKTTEVSLDATFKVADLNALRDKASDLFKDAPYLPSKGLHKITDKNGYSGTWGQSPRDPMLLLRLFNRIHLKKGWRLVAYQWLDGMGGYVRVYGLPEGAPFPEPADCMRQEKVPASEQSSAYEYRFPKPPRGVKDLGSLIEVDGTPESYAEKALFLQEVSEMGAYWHAIGWGDCHLVDSMESLVNAVMRTNNTSKDEKQRAEERQRVQTEIQNQWTWTKPRLADFRPHFRRTSESIEVVWFTFSGRGVESLDRWTFTFKTGSTKTSGPEVEHVAKGTHGFMY